MAALSRVTASGGAGPTYPGAMTTEPRPDASRKPHERPDAGHLDEDAEALEDPVHAGDARHQHERHEHERHEPPEEERAEPEPGAD